jgi:AraC family transcriptional regulator
MRLRDYFSVAGEETAKELLLQSRLPMIEIALKCRFADRACFIRRFHKLLNTTPGGWRKKRENSGAACNFPAGNGSNDR